MLHVSVHDKKAEKALAYQSTTPHYSDLIQISVCMLGTVMLVVTDLNVSGRNLNRAALQMYC